jgi:hypothetical protein
MWSIVLISALSCCGDRLVENAPDPSESVLAEIKQGLQTGSLLFSRGDCLAVKVFSQSSYTHVAGVIACGDDFVVYDSMNGVGIRKMGLSDYLRQQTPNTIHVVHPKDPFTMEKRDAYERHLESQLGRKYSVKHHLTGQRCDGLHCSEYMTDALMAAELISAQQPSRVSPGSLLEGVIKTKVYIHGNRLDLKSQLDSEPLDRRWYHRAWRETCTCCSKSVVQVRRWVLCR